MDELKNNEREMRNNDELIFPVLTNFKLFKDITNKGDLFIKASYNSKKIMEAFIPVIAICSLAPFIDAILCLGVEASMVILIGKCFEFNYTVDSIKEALKEINFSGPLRIAIFVGQSAMRIVATVIDE